MNVSELLDETTTIYRKGPEVAEKDVGGIRVVDVWVDTPPAEEAPRGEGTAVVDCHFLLVAVDLEAARRLRGELEGILDAWPPDPTYASENRLAGGPSYLELGAQIGTLMGQQDAFRLMALGEALEMWTVITPRTLLGEAISDADADRLAGGGMVMISGYKGGED